MVAIRRGTTLSIERPSARQRKPFLCVDSNLAVRGPAERCVVDDRLLFSCRDRHTQGVNPEQSLGTPPTAPSLAAHSSSPNRSYRGRAPSSHSRPSFRNDCFHERRQPRFRVHLPVESLRSSRSGRRSVPSRSVHPRPGRCRCLSQSSGPQWGPLRRRKASRRIPSHAGRRVNACLRDLPRPADLSGERHRSPTCRRLPNILSTHERRSPASTRFRASMSTTERRTSRLPQPSQRPLPLRAPRRRDRAPPVDSRAATSASPERRPDP